MRIGLFDSINAFQQNLNVLLQHIEPFNTVQCILYSGKVKVWRINRSANRLSIVSTKLDSFGLVNHERFAKFAKIFPAKFSRYTLCADCSIIEY